MSASKKLIIPILLTAMILPISPVMAVLTLQQAVNSIQATDPALPTGVANPKGSIGSLLAELFWGTGDGVKNGKIKPQYIDYAGISAWTQSESDAYYSGTGNVGIGTTPGASYKLDVAGTIKSSDLLLSNKLNCSGKLYTDASGNVLCGTDTDTIYSHPTGDGNLHVPETSTTNNGKVLTAGITAGSLSWTTLPSAPVTSVAGKTGVVTLVKGDVGLGSVDNTSDINKPISTATQVALDLKANTASPILTGDPTGSTPITTDNDNSLATTAFVKAQSYLTSFTEIDPKIGSNILNYLAKWNGSALVKSNIFDDGTNIGIGTTDPQEKLDVRGNSYLSSTSIGRSGGHYQEIGYNIGFTTTNDTYTYRFTDTAASMRMGYDGFEFRTAPSGLVGSGLILSEKMRITAGGKVGIGTPSPNKLLHLKTPTGANAELNIQSGTKPLWGIYHDETSEELRFWNGANRVVFGSGGNVGIGTTEPTYPLEVKSNVGAATLGLVGRGSDSISSVDFLNAGKTLNAYIQGNGSWIRSRADGGFHFAKGATPTVTGTDFTIEGLNVGIGTTPGASYKLDVAGTIKTTDLLLSNKLNCSGKLYTDASGNVLCGTDNAGLAINTTGYIPKSNGTALVDSSIFASGANIGIGTTNPRTNLEINGSYVSDKGSLYVKGISDHGYIAIDTDTPATKEAGIIFNKGVVRKWITYVPQNSNDLRFADSADRVTFQAGGNVGIGTVTPGKKLEVSGDITTTQVGNFLYGRYAVDSDNYISGLGFNGSVGGVLQLGNNGLNEIRAGTTNAGGYFNFIVNNTALPGAVNNGTVAMTMAANGNISIPSSSAGGLSIGETYTNYDGWDKQLTVAGSAHSRITTKTATVRMGMYAHDAWQPVSGTTPGGFIGTYNNYPVSFLTNATQRMVIDTSGYVGIGTSSPSTNLHVAKTYSSTIPVVRFDNGSQAAYQANYDTALFVQPDVPSLRLIETNDGTLATQQELSMTAGDNNAVIRSSSTVLNGLSIMVNANPGAPGYNTGLGTLGIKILNSGYVGIGNPSPDYKLDVSGDIHATGTIYGNISGNADTVDSLHAASFLRSDTGNTSIPIAAADGNGLKFWGGSDVYKISMGNAAEYHYGPVTDYSIKTVIDSVSSTRGFTWGQNGVAPIAGLNVGNGNMQIAGTMTAPSYTVNGGGQFMAGNTALNMKLKAGTTGATGISGFDSLDIWRWQLYGDGTNYGFLNGNWAGWDMNKTIGGALVLNGSQTVLHSGNYNSYSPTLTGGGASGDWGINVTGNAATATYASNSSKLYSTDTSYQYGGGAPYYGYLTYNSPAARWRFQVSPATPAGVEVAYSDSAGNSSTATNATNVTSTIGGVAIAQFVQGQPYGAQGANPTYDTRTMGRDTYNADETFALGKAGFLDIWKAGGLPPGTSHVQGFQAMHYSGGYGLQLAGQYDQDAVYVRQATAGTLRGWRKLVDSGNVGSYAVTSESDPTVSAWAKAASKPAYDFSEITGSATDAQIPDDHTINTTTDITVNGLKVGKGAGNIASNTAFGVTALNANTTGVSNTANGNNSLYNNTTGGNNTAIGTNSLYSNTTGGSNTAIGRISLYLNTTGSSNTAIGNNSLYNNTTGNSNTAIGISSLYSNTTGLQNTANGSTSLYSNKAGSNGVAIGSYSQQYANDTTTIWTNYNTSVGFESLRGSITAANNTGNFNDAFGYRSLFSNTTGSNNTANGYGSLYSNTTGGTNAAFGVNSLYSNTTGINNTAIGQGSLFANTTGYGNAALGTNSLSNNTTGHNNTANGFWAGKFITDGVTANAISNTSVYLGSLTKAGANGNSNEIVIGYNAIGGGSNTVVLGNSSITATYLKGSVYATSYLFTSDRRLKKNIQTLTGSLSKIQGLNGVSFDWKKSGEQDIGFIAQEVEKVEPKLVKTASDEQGLKSVKYANITALLVNAVKELSTQMDELFLKYFNQQKELERQIKEIEILKQSVQSLQGSMYLMNALHTK